MKQQDNVGETLASAPLTALEVEHEHHDSLKSSVMTMNQTRHVRLLLVASKPQHLRRFADITGAITGLSLSVTVAPSIDAGGVALIASRYDAVILAVSGDGYAEASLLASLPFAHWTPASIVLMADTDTDLVEEFVARGAMASLTFDEVTPALLDRALRHALRQREVERLLLGQAVARRGLADVTAQLPMPPSATTPSLFRTTSSFPSNVAVTLAPAPFDLVGTLQAVRDRLIEFETPAQRLKFERLTGEPVFVKGRHASFFATACSVLHTLSHLQGNEGSVLLRVCPEDDRAALALEQLSDPARNYLGEKADLVVSQEPYCSVDLSSSNSAYLWLPRTAAVADKPVHVDDAAMLRSMEAGHADVVNGVQVRRRSSLEG